MHAVGRIAYRGWIDNIQVSWVKMGHGGAAQILQAGANDLGGTLMDENISRAAGASHGTMMDEDGFRGVGRAPRSPPRAAHHALRPPRARRRPLIGHDHQGSSSLASMSRACSRVHAAHSHSTPRAVVLSDQPSGSTSSTVPLVVPQRVQ